MKKLSITFLVVALLIPSLESAEFSEVVDALGGREEQAKVELAKVSKDIETEKIPMIRQRNNLEAEVIKLRQEVERMKMLQTSRDNLLKSATTSAETRRKEVEYLTGLIADYSRNFETRIHIAEVQRYKPLITDAQIAVDDHNLADNEKISRQMPLVSASIDRLKGLLGGDAFEGEALAGDGRLVAGKLVLLGPVTVFNGGPGAVGTVELVLGSLEPTIVTPEKEHLSAIASLVDSGTGSLPIDASGGNARKLAATQDTILQQWRKGGPVMVPILGLGFISVIIGLFKWAQIGRIRQPAARDVQIIIEHLKADREAKAIAHAEGIGGPAGAMLKRAIENADEDKELLEEVIYEQLLDTRPKLEKLMPLIALTAATAPLLGLLGTVTGMINTFNLISVFGTGDPRMLSSGISEALITTMYGLIVAIPALLLHAVISRKAKGLLGSMEQAAVAFVNGTPKQQAAE